MAKWAHYFKQLNDNALSIFRDPSVLGQTQSVESAFQSEWDSKSALAPAITCLIDTELSKGFETSLSSLESCSAGWRYKGVPVFVFAAKVPEIANKQRRDSFYYQVHLKPCCNALSGVDRTVWVANRVQAAEPWQHQRAFEVCHHCLVMTGYQNYRSLSSAEQSELRADFDFTRYVKWHATEYFPDVEYGYWMPGEKLKFFAVGGNETVEKCNHCRWPLPKNSPGLVRDASLFDLNGPTCICCLDGTAKVAIMSEAVLLHAYAQRYWEWRRAYIEEQGLGMIASQTIKFSWSQLSYHFPRKWQPLITVLKQFEPADIYCLAEKGYALLAWPRLRRAIVLSDKDKVGFPGGWEVWTYEEVLENL
ncbi:hypothetical protein [Marinagarivorans algicola]|uniref:hypothetical protein n=1 Tax=Marinagarivorans algicola TaxID=1513270 RepID=UPI0006B9B33C|nr:hypothetical protein [Marinagarivorans algicola]